MSRTGSVRTVRGARPWWLVAAVLAMVGALSLTWGLRGRDHALPAPSPSRGAASAAIATPDTVAPLATARSVPVTLSIPALGVSVPVSTLGLNPDGTVQVPSGTQQPGWFRLGPTPGEVGSAVLLGHVDSYVGPGVFFQLRTLTSGDQVDVGLADGVTAQFTVTNVAMYEKQQFPAQRVYGSDGASALQLVTCGGTFDQRTGSYLSNVVVYTSLTAVIPPAIPIPAPPAPPAPT